MDRGAWQATVHGVTKSQMQLSGFTSVFVFYFHTCVLCFVKLAKFCLIRMLLPTTDFPCDSAGKESTCRNKLKKKKKESTCNAGDLGSIPRLGRCPGEGKG